MDKMNGKEAKIMDDEGRIIDDGHDDTNVDFHPTLDDLGVISDNDTFCPMCGSGETFMLGKLGKLTWYKCQCCGVEYGNE